MFAVTSTAGEEVNLRRGEKGREERGEREERGDRGEKGEGKRGERGERGEREREGHGLQPIHHQFQLTLSRAVGARAWWMESIIFPCPRLSRR